MRWMECLKISIIQSSILKTPIFTPSICVCRGTVEGESSKLPFSLSNCCFEFDHWQTFVFLKGTKNSHTSIEPSTSTARKHHEDGNTYIKQQQAWELRICGAVPYGYCWFRPVKASRLPLPRQATTYSEFPQVEARRPDPNHPTSKLALWMRQHLLPLQLWVTVTVPLRFLLLAAELLRYV